jgi:hypothetical protein
MPLGTSNHYYRIFKRGQFPEYTPLSEYVALFRHLFNDDLTRLTAYLDEGTTELSTIQFLTLWWLAAIEWYLPKYEQGIPIVAVRYDDMNTYREQIITEVFRYCGLPAAAVPETLSVFARDAQAGTDLARDNPQEGNKLRLSDEQRNDVIRILQRHPVIRDSDFVVPGTLRV